MIFQSNKKLGIRNNTGSPQILPAGCDAQLGTGLAPTVVAPGQFLIIPAGAQITAPSNAWFTLTSDWLYATDAFDAPPKPPGVVPTITILSP
jgi:hypothetical protein